MPNQPTSSQAAEDWRLRVELTGEHAAEHAGRLHKRLRPGGQAPSGSGSEPAEGAQGPDSLPEQVVLTLDGSRLFAYADSEELLDRAAAAIQAALDSEQSSAQLITSHWDADLDDWLQVKPPPDSQQRSALQTRRRSFDEHESRKLVISAGRFVRAEVERTMARYAEELGLSCQIVEHPHLLSTQIAFTVSGECGKIDQFAAALRDEGMATLRADLQYLSSAL